MSEPSHKYPKRVAKTIVDHAISFGMPVPKVENMYEYAKSGASRAVDLAASSYPDEMARNTAYFAIFRRFFLSGLKKYSSRMPEYEKTEVREIITRNRDKLIEGLTRNDSEKNNGGDQTQKQG